VAEFECARAFPGSCEESGKSEYVSAVGIAIFQDRTTRRSAVKGLIVRVVESLPCASSTASA
jgi:hypothetical protein